MLLLSALVCLVVTTSVANIVHTFAKLGFSSRGYGSVNIMLLLVSIVWSLGGFSIAIRICDIHLGRNELSGFLLWIVIDVAAVSLVALAFDSWLAVYPLLGLGLELLEWMIAGWLGCTCIVRRRDANLLFGISAGSLFGLLGLIGATAFLLLICPRTVLRL
jgi:hypothetical protein